MVGISVGLDVGFRVPLVGKYVGLDVIDVGLSVGILGWFVGSGVGGGGKLTLMH